MLVAALIDGVLFGIIHWDFSSAEALLIIPPLAALGFMFCLVYERTGTLYSVIGLHALNNSVAYAAACMRAKEPAEARSPLERVWRIDVRDRGVQRPPLSLRHARVTLRKGTLTADLGKQFVRWGKASTGTS